ncbi:MAG TPA: DUF3341 domain-containing protein [Verrucomicrobiae bacterium]|nr:DUF3341 domain-containing protein [Verrucomicrobiae bacterium]
MNESLPGHPMLMEPPETMVAGKKILYGLMAEFEDHEQLLEATKRAYMQGYREMDAYAPFPVEGLAEALGREGSLVPLITLVGGMAGGLGGYFMEWYSMARLYPLNVGGRPHNSWPNFIPVTFELTVLIASLSALTAMLVLNRLPQPHHPVFNVPEFRRASIDRFFLSIETEDPAFERGPTWKFLESLKPLKVTEVWDE